MNTQRALADLAESIDPTKWAYRSDRREDAGRSLVIAYAKAQVGRLALEARTRRIAAAELDGPMTILLRNGAHPDDELFGRVAKAVVRDERK